MAAATDLKLFQRILSQLSKYILNVCIGRAGNTYEASFESQPAVILASTVLPVDFSLTRTSIGAMNRANSAQRFTMQK
jgi:hypothetical protein